MGKVGGADKVDGFEELTPTEQRKVLQAFAAATKASSKLKGLCLFCGLVPRFHRFKRLWDRPRNPVFLMA